VVLNISLYFSEIFNDKNSQKNGQTLKVANAMFLQNNYNISSQFQYILQSRYHSTVQKVDFTQSENTSAL